MKPSELEEFAVVIGRFQPPHRGHVHLLKEARKLCQKVIVVVGSSDQSPNVRNPWSFSERAAMICAALGFSNSQEMERAGYVLTPAGDIPYNEQAWVRRIYMAVSGILATHSLNPSKTKIRLVGLKKDITSYYLDMFPTWEMSEIKMEESLDSTVVRSLFFEYVLTEDTKPFVSSACPASINKYLTQLAKNPSSRVLANEWAYIEEEKKSWSKSPFPPVFVTADAVVVQGGHILLVTRGNMPGNGLLALPGGHLLVTESLQTTMLRELLEETSIKVPAKVLLGSIKRTKVYDYPLRSNRGRVITHAYFIELPGSGQGLPHVRGGDDASSAAWYPLASITPQLLFEDHFHIIQDLMGLNG